MDIPQQQQQEEEDYKYNNNFYCKKSGGQIPAFGNWDYAKDLPITQYFDSPRQAGLIRFTHSSAAPAAALHFPNPKRQHKGQPPAMMKKKKVSDYFTGHPTKLHHNPKQNGTKLAAAAANKSDRRVPGQENNAKKVNIVRAVDEDLYKISPELLHSSKKKKLGFFSRCLVPACMV